MYTFTYTRHVVYGHDPDYWLGVDGTSHLARHIDGGPTGTHCETRLTAPRVIPRKDVVT